ncbi:MAG: ATP-binding protein [Phycisphaerae bacterium]|nr:ATP-binding protein [Phycisphaerae bacterium]
MAAKDAGEKRDTAMVEVVISTDLRAARAAEERILRAVEAHGYRREATFAIRLSLEEAITNAVKHGNGNDRSKHVRLRYHITDKEAVIYVADEGPGFNPGTVPDPTTPPRLSLPSGRGIMLMRAYLDEVRYNRKGNEVCLVKKNE